MGGKAPHGFVNHEKYLHLHEFLSSAAYDYINSIT